MSQIRGGSSVKVGPWFESLRAHHKTRCPDRTPGVAFPQNDQHSRGVCWTLVITGAARSLCLHRNATCSSSSRLSLVSVSLRRESNSPNRSLRTNSSALKMSICYGGLTEAYHGTFVCLNRYCYEDSLIPILAISFIVLLSYFKIGALLVANSPSSFRIAASELSTRPASNQAGTYRPMAVFAVFTVSSVMGNTRSLPSRSTLSM